MITVKHKDRFRHSAIHSGSILWELMQKEYADKRAEVIRSQGKLLDMPQWRSTKG